MKQRNGIALLFGLALMVFAPELRATTVGPQTELTTSQPTVSQRAPAVAFDGTRYVVVWEDARSVASGIELFLARIAPDGTIVDPTGLQVLSPAQPNDQLTPQIAFHQPNGHFLLTWADNRGGTSEIYASRFIPNIPLFPEPGGTQITNTVAEAESRPAVACATQSCLVVFTQTFAGNTQIRGSRVYPSGDLQDQMPLDLVANNTGAQTELAPAITATTASFFVVWEDDRNRNMGQLGADLYGRTVSDLGTVTAQAGSVISSADFRQSFPSLAMITPSQMIALWQDQRAGTSTSAGEDIWRARFGLNLAPAGSAAGLVLAPRPQLSPKIAAAGGRGLAVWQDFRNGVFGLTYASRVDASGNLLDGSGFPAIALSSNMIEHAVAKGPGNDYLVLSVRSTPAPSRIFYRIVRDEPPAGMMTATGTFNVPADGMTRAQVTFATARGASGFTVADGTLYTLTLSRGNVAIDAPDADPNRAGHQVVALNGEIALTFSTLAPGPLTVSVASVEGTSIGSQMVTFANVPPRVSNVSISPSNPRSDQDLTVNYTYSDINGDAEGMTQIQWTRDSAIQPMWNNQRTVPASATSRDQIWRVSVRPHDGRDFAPAFTFSGTVLILNTPPVALAVRIVPDAAVKTGTTLARRYTFDDPDNDPESGTLVRWYLNGVEQPALAGAAEVPGAQVIKGQRWYFTVTPSDGTDAGPLVSSSTVTVENSVPIAAAGSNDEVLERRSYTLDARGSSDVDPQDTLSFTWRQISGPMITLSGTSTPAPSFTAPSVRSTQQLIFGLTVSDGESVSVEDQVVVLVTAVLDADGDNLDDEEEMLAGTNPGAGDTDRDGAGDGVEVENGWDPLDEDSDDDGVRDGAEVMGDQDSDMDGADNALDPDSDNDGLWDGTEIGVLSPTDGTDTTANTFIADADRASTTDPINPDTDGDMINDGTEDANHNGRVDLGESDPNDPTSLVGCTPDRMCPAPLACVDDACRQVGGPDGGQCTPISARNLECCTGGCANGTLAAPVCAGAGLPEGCPTGASTCPINSCTDNTVDPGDSGSCGCSATKPSESAVWSIFALAALVFARKRDRSNY